MAFNEIRGCLFLCVTTYKQSMNFTNEANTFFVHIPKLSLTKAWILQLVYRLDSLRMSPERAGIKLSFKMISIERERERDPQDILGQS